MVKCKSIRELFEIIEKSIHRINLAIEIRKNRYVFHNSREIKGAAQLVKIIKENYKAVMPLQPTKKIKEDKIEVI